MVFFGLKILLRDLTKPGEMIEGDSKLKIMKYFNQFIKRFSIKIETQSKSNLAFFQFAIEMTQTSFFLKKQ
jgi:hypothetical protein